MGKIFIFDFDGTLTTASLPSPFHLEKFGINERVLNSKIIEMLKFRLAQHNEFFCKTLFEAFLIVLHIIKADMSDEGLTRRVENVTYNKGVKDFLEKSKQAGNTNYLLSSDMKVFMERTEIAGYFEDIIGTTFNYNSKGEAVSVDTLVYDEKKILAIKGILISNGLDPEDTSGVVYFGDGLTDLLAMEYVKTHGGKVVFIENSTNDDFRRCVLSRGIVDISTRGDFTVNGEISKFLSNQTEWQSMECENNAKFQGKLFIPKSNI